MTDTLEIAPCNEGIKGWPFGASRKQQQRKKIFSGFRDVFRVTFVHDMY